MASPVYSFKNLALAFTDPDVGQFSTSGQIGFGSATVSMATERTAMLVAADGTVLISAMAGNNGHVMITCLQTSIIHTFLLSWYNAKIAKLNSGDISTWAAAKMSLRNTTTNTYHNCQGVAPSKIPDYPYEAQGKEVTWNIPCADIQNG